MQKQSNTAHCCKVNLIFGNANPTSASCSEPAQAASHKRSYHMAIPTQCCICNIWNKHLHNAISQGDSQQSTEDQGMSRILIRVQGVEDNSVLPCSADIAGVTTSDRNQLSSLGWVEKKNGCSHFFHAGEIFNFDPHLAWVGWAI